MGDHADDIIDRHIFFNDFAFGPVFSSSWDDDDVPEGCWQLKDGKIVEISSMETTHIFHSARLIYNLLASAYGFPTIWYKNNGNPKLIECLEEEGPEGSHCVYALEKLRDLYSVLKVRPDINGSMAWAVGEMERNLSNWWKDCGDIIEVSCFIKKQEDEKIEVSWGEGL